MSDFDDMKIISTYTTKEAVADGTLVRVTDYMSKECGIKYPVYLTRAVWDKYVKVPAGMEFEQNLSDRLWDILWMFRIAAKSTPGQLLLFKLNCRLPDKGNWEKNEKMDGDRLTRTVTLKTFITAQDFDDPSPAIFIMKPDED
jgi:hypothetical protein